MQDLIDLFRHNSWANGKVFDLVAGLDAQVIAGEAPGTRSTVTGTLAHLARVEYVYLAMLEQRPWPSVESDAAYGAHDLSWFRSHVQELSAAYLTLLDAITPESLGRALDIPWFSFSVTAREGLLQVLTHSAQHRSQVLSWLSTRGVPTPDLDYVLMLREMRQPE